MRSPPPSPRRGYRSLLLALVVLLCSAAVAFSQGVPFRRGDSNQDGNRNLSDAVHVLGFLFRGDPAPPCLDSADFDDDGRVVLTDAVFLLAHLFRGGPPPPAPGSVCGLDPTADELDCGEFPSCQPPPSVLPALAAFTLTPSGRGEFLIYDGPLGFRRDLSFVRLYGLRFRDVREIVLSDSFGFESFLGRGAFQLERAEPGNAYDTLSFHLHDDQTDVRFLFLEERENLGVRLRGHDGYSNRMEIPVVTSDSTREIGAVINAVKVPTGTVTGPVWIHYSLYERVIDAAWALDVEFTIDGGGNWFPAAPKEDEPEHDGNTGLLAGVLRQQIPGAFFPGGGALRTFVWDGLHDPVILEANGGVGPEGRRWTVRFRLRPVPETSNRVSVDHTVETPDVHFHFLPEGREARQEVFLENFQSDDLEDSELTTALWGPPENRGLLAGALGAAPDPFGAGTAVVRLSPLENPPEPVEPQNFTQFFVIDTDAMTITHHQLDNNGTPDEPEDDVTLRATPVVFENPGAERGEFHLAKLTIVDGAFVRTLGSRPLVVRLAGDGEGRETIVFENAGVLDLSGAPGGDGGADANDPFLPGEGGRGGPGGGAGGRGALLRSEAQHARITLIELAEDGGNDGGGRGETTGAVHYDTFSPRPSVFAGAPGGGGGHRRSGESAEYGRNTILEYQLPRSGRGGAPRGERHQLLLTAGSGGGGGGATLSRIPVSMVPTFASLGGGGGGGGGGALRLVARGSIEVNGRIVANGGPGGSGLVPPVSPQLPRGSAPGGAGGGGSGGSIVLQASGRVLLSGCDSLQVRGGAGGTGVRDAFGGNGAPGWIRLESGVGALPPCVALEARTVLSAQLSAGRNVDVSVQSTIGFPESGVIIIEGEHIAYRETTNTLFLDVTRAVNDPDGVPAAHPVGAAVVLRGPVGPWESPVLEESGIAVAPDPLDEGPGRDGSLHLPFLPSVDPATGDPVVDPQTGRPVSLWTFDTGRGAILSPDGEVVLEAAGAQGEPGLLDLHRLRIDEDVVLRVVGPQAPQILVRERAEIAGAIDVSGLPGGPLRFTVPGTEPLPGLGGDAGPGGGDGGDGGAVRFLDGNPENKDPANTVPVHGGDGGLPPGLAVVLPGVQVATGGRSLEGRECGTGCVESAGGGGGGGNFEAGGDGSAVVLPGGLNIEDLIGRGGASFGNASIRAGALFLRGGGGGSGGGASANVSDPYSAGLIEGVYPFQGRALLAPGAGGGGGGGALRLQASELFLASTARLLARGGEAYQSIDLGGNGGAGAGGNILVQVVRALTVEAGASIDVRGGIANRLPPLNADGLFLYEGNVREGAHASPAVEGFSYGGNGGNGSPGRVRVEMPEDLRLRLQGMDGSYTAGGLLHNVVQSVAVSKTVPLGLGPDLAATSPAIEPGAPSIRFPPGRLLPGTDAVVLWQGAREGVDQLRPPGAVRGLVEDPRTLEDTEFVRFVVVLLSDAEQGSAAVDTISLPYRLPE